MGERLDRLEGLVERSIRAAEPQEEHRVALRHRVARDQHFAGRDGVGPTLVLVRGAPLLLHEAQILRVRVGDRRNEALGVLRVPAVEERVRDPNCEIEICRVGGGQPEPMSSRFVATPERVERDRRGFDGMDARGVDRQNVLCRRQNDGGWRASLPHRPEETRAGNRPSRVRRDALASGLERAFGAPLAKCIFASALERQLQSCGSDRLGEER